MCIYASSGRAVMKSRASEALESAELSGPGKRRRERKEGREREREERGEVEVRELHRTHSDGGERVGVSLLK